MTLETLFFNQRRGVTRFAMKYLLVLSLLLGPLLQTQAQVFDTEYGQPILVLIEENPNLMVIGSDVPTFALYENGQIIYRDATAPDPQYRQVKLTQPQAQDFILTLGITDALLEQPRLVRASQAADQPTNELMLHFDSVKIMTVYGALRGTAAPARSGVFPGYLAVYDKLTSYTNDAAKRWVPGRVEVLLTDYSHSPAAPRKWPYIFPDLNDPTTVRRNESLYSIYIDGRDYATLLKLQKSLGPKQAVEINGRKFSVSSRVPFPNIQ